MQILASMMRKRNCKQAVEKTSQQTQQSASDKKTQNPSQTPPLFSQLFDLQSTAPVPQS